MIWSCIRWAISSRFMARTPKKPRRELGLQLVSRAIPVGGRVEMCGFPANRLEQYLEQLRAKHDVTVSATLEGSTQRREYPSPLSTMRPNRTSTPMKQSMVLTGSRRSGTKKPSKPPLSGSCNEQYKPIVLEAVIQDIRYRNACGHSDYENAVIEGNAAIRRAVLGAGNMGLLRLYSDTPEFRQRLHGEVIDETYPKLHELLRPLSDNDIDRAIQDWNGKIESKHAVVRYMKDHARERDTAAWLAHEFDGGDGKTPFCDPPGKPPKERRCPGQRCSAGLPSSSRRIASTPRSNRIIWTMWTPSPSGRPWPSAALWTAMWWTRKSWTTTPLFSRSCGMWRPYPGKTTQAEQPEQPSSGDSRVPVSDKEYAAARGTVRERTSMIPTVPPYNVGDIVYLDDLAHRITELRDDTVQLLPTGMSYPIYRAESRERFEHLLREDNRNDFFYTEFLPANLDTVDQDLRDVLAHGLIGEADKAELSELLRNGKSNQEVALWLSRASSQHRGNDGAGDRRDRRLPHDAGRY